jgi:hypothetical protein
MARWDQVALLAYLEIGAVVISTLGGDMKEWNGMVEGAEGRGCTISLQPRLGI